MSHKSFENLWNILRNYQFVIDVVSNSDVICTICNNLLINCHFGPCGCKYCLDCITNYLDGSNKLCPGNMDDCKIELLNIDSNVHVENLTNFKISKLMMKCPQTLCYYKNELRKMEDHLRVCNGRAINCPYCNIGCKFDKVANDKLEEHLLLDNQVHVKLLMECIDVMRNEMDSLKKENLQLRQKIELDEERNKIANLQFHNKIEQQTREIADLNQDIVALRNVDRCQEDELKIVQTRDQETNAKFDQLKENISALIRDNLNMKQQINNMKKQTEVSKMDNLQIKKQTNEQDAQINQLKTDIRSTTNKFSQIEQGSEKKQEISNNIAASLPSNTNENSLFGMSSSRKPKTVKIKKEKKATKQISNNKF